MAKLVTKIYSRMGRKQVKFFEYGLYEFLKEELEFRFTKIQGKGCFLQWDKGYYKKVQFFEIRDAFVLIIKTEFEKLGVFDQITRDEFLEEFYRQKPIKNGTYIRDFLEKDFQLSEVNIEMILDQK